MMTMDPDWWNPRPSTVWGPARDEIICKRRLLLVHSAIYYRLNSSLVSDYLWQEWANYLAYLQDDYGWQVGFYDSAFEDWDGSTGYHLPADMSVLRVAEYLLKMRDKPVRRAQLQQLIELC
jgi:hypothetical protein